MNDKVNKRLLEASQAACRDMKHYTVMDWQYQFLRGRVDGYAFASLFDGDVNTYDTIMSLLRDTCAEIFNGES